jgi:TolB-like protein/DNA-binding winged helix-turn-helix (wHTH) protein/Flp pilus assembly protein TadD
MESDSHSAAGRKPVQGDFRIGEWLIEPTLNAVSRNGASRHLEPKVMAVLVCLAKAQNAAVPKQQLIEEVWKDTFVTDDVLIRCISELREAFGDDARNPAIIQTIPKQGYRLLKPTLQPVDRRRRWLWTATLIAGAALVAASAIYVWSHRLSRPATNSAPRAMLAVLPFENLTSDPEQEYFTDGLTEELINELGRFHPHQLRVIARTSVMRYKGGSRNVAEIGRELGVDYVLEGSVRRESGRVRISTHLTPVRDQTSIWVGSYDRELGRILELQNEVARSVAQQIKLQLSPQEQARLVNARPVDPEAFDLYLRGRFHFNQRTDDDVKKSIEYFQKATEKDPSYALAYAALSQAYNVATYRALIPGHWGYQQAEAMAQRALQLDNTLGEAHAALAGLCSDSYRWQEAVAEFERALKLDPNSVTARGWYADTLTFLGRYDEAVRQMKLALEIDPFSLSVNRRAGEHLYIAHRYDEAIAQYRKTLDLYPYDSLAYFGLWHSYIEKGLYDDAVDAFIRASELEKDPPEQVAAYRKAYRDRGIRGVWRLRAEMLTRKGIRPTSIACSYARLGEKDQAFKYLEKAFAIHAAPADFLEPCFDNLRSDPRSREIVRRMNLPEN